MLTVEETRDIAACQEIRRIVFVEGQGVPADLEVDGADEDAVHVIARIDGEPVGTARYLAQGDVAKIGRVCVLERYRGHGIGVALMRALSDVARTRGMTSVTLGAQVPVIGFYEKLGYVAEGEIFMDAGIPHRTMTIRL